MRLIFVRHGETEQNKKKILQGWAEGQLTEEGQRQAELLGKRLSKLKIDYIYSSDLKRTRQTSAQITKFVKAPIKFEKKLREINMGVYENGSYEAYEEALASAEARLKFKPENGESIGELQKRLIDFYEGISKKHKEDNVLLVSHGTAIGNLLLLFFQDEGMKFEDFSHHNTAVTIVEVTDKPKLVMLNSIDHLK